MPFNQALNSLHRNPCQVSDKVTGKEAAQWVEPYPSLSGSTLAVWYRTCCEQLQVGRGQWGGKGLQLLNLCSMTAREQASAQCDCCQAGL